MKVETPWIVTYDDASETRTLYKDRRQFAIGVNYSLNEKKVGAELLVASKGLRVPLSARARQVNRPQYRASASAFQLSA